MPLAPPCSRCSLALSPTTDLSSSGAWKSRCADCRDRTSSKRKRSGSSRRPLGDLPSANSRSNPHVVGNSEFSSSPNTSLSSPAHARSSSSPVVPEPPRSSQPLFPFAIFSSTRVSSAPTSSLHTDGSSSPHALLEDDDLIDLPDFEEAEQHAYTLPPSPPNPRMGQAHYLDDPAITNNDYTLIRNFHKQLDKIQIEACNTCNRKWFNLNIVRNRVGFSECRDCTKDRHEFGNTEGFVPLFSRANNMDPGPVPAHLPTLTSVEEMLIARVHVMMEIRQHRGAQYKYRGHICHFSVNSGRVFSRLPLIPESLDILVLKPPASEDNDPQLVDRQFRKDYKVRREHVVTWLLYLQQKHPGYRDVTLNADAVSSLPEDDYVDHRLRILEQEETLVSVNEDTEQPATTATASTAATSSSSSTPTAPLGDDGAELSAQDPQPSRENNGDPSSREPLHDIGQGQQNHEDVLLLESSFFDDDLDLEDEPLSDTVEADEEEEPPEVGVVPDFAADVTEFEILQAQIQQRRQHTRAAFLSMGSVQRTPLQEFNAQQPLLSLAFPTLFPRGDAEFLSPRMREVDFLSYCRCLMLYQDGRFASHSRFRYVVFNQIMRRTSSARAGFNVRGRDASAEDIQAAFDGPDGGRSLIDAVVRWSANIRGTRGYWASEGKKLEAMVRQLKCPTLFITLSAADYHWYDLLRFMPNFQQWRDAPQAERMRMATVFVRDNPHTVAAYFHLRFNAFRKEVLNPKFGIVDYWYRYEWQGRGSTHSHGLYYCENVPDPDAELGNHQSDFRLRRLAQYWSRSISAMHPEPLPDALMEERSTLSLPFSEMRFDFGDLSSILTRCYLHRCFAAYCLRKNRTTGLEVCRFEAPWAITTEATFSKAPGKSYHRFQAQRNHCRLNAYSPTIVLGWRANADIQVCTSTTGVVQYMGVYASKGESATLSYRDLAVQVLPHLNGSSPWFSFAAKLMNKLVGERDYSAQEVMHLFFGYPLVQSSRVTLNVDCRPEDQQCQSFNFNRRAADILDDEPVFEESTGVYQKYKTRRGLNNVSYIDYLLHYTHRRGNEKRRPRGKPRVLNFIPRYNHLVDPNEFARVKVMLHHPFRNLADSLTIAGVEHDDWVSAYGYCQTHCKHDIKDSYGDADLGIDEDNPDLEEIVVEPDASFDELGLRRPGSVGVAVDEELLGSRPMDRLYDWMTDLHCAPPDMDPLTYWRNIKRDHPAIAEISSLTTSLTLSGKQQIVFDLVVNHYTAHLGGRSPPQLLINLDGEGGTGKTYTIESISRAVDSLAAAHGHSTPLLRCAPTGVAAFLISGRTLNSVFRIPINVKSGNLEPLLVAGKQQLQSQFRSLKYLIIDEKSMVSLQMLAWIHGRCREACPQSADMPFGGLNVILSGDFCQLPPVGRRPLFDNAHRSSVDAAGCLQYRGFNRTVELDVVMRQVGTSQARFRDALSRLRTGSSTQNDWALFMTRCRSVLPQLEQQAFHSAPRLCPTRRAVAEINHEALRDFSSPVVVLNAKHDKPEWAAVDTKDAGNLQNQLPLCIGARVMLLHNVWTERGLVNGSSGVVENIVWDEGVRDRRSHAPVAVLVAFDSYQGPALYTTADGRAVVPIFPERREFCLDREVCSRTQFPLTLSWAITIHKSQGMTLDRAVLRVGGGRDFVPGLLYVAVSRVRSLEGLMFDEPISFARLKGRESAFTQQRTLDYARRAGQHVAATDVTFP